MKDMAATHTLYTARPQRTPYDGGTIFSAWGPRPCGLTQRHQRQSLHRNLERSNMEGNELGLGAER